VAGLAGSALRVAPLAAAGRSRAAAAGRRRLGASAWLLSGFLIGAKGWSFAG
jgi:hypothetical protein